MAVAFTLNGVARTFPGGEDESLLDVLRDVYGLTSPKDGCSPQGQCGCCTVLVDGKALVACTTPMSRVAGRHVTSLEGVAEDERKQFALTFAAHGALQCGFCTPGIVMRAKALLDKHGRELTREAAARNLGAHLCRCTGYQSILDAVEALARGEEPALCTDGRIGERLVRYQGFDLALGTHGYVADIAVPNLLHGAYRLTEHARAKVLAIDTAAAAAMPGVRAVLTAADIPGARRIGILIDDWQVMVPVGGETAYTGDVLACVAADTRAQARAAAVAVTVEYEVLEPVLDPRRALEPDAPVVHEGGNLAGLAQYRRGDLDGLLASSAHVVRETFRTQRIEHAYLEPEAALAVPCDAAWREVTDLPVGGPFPPDARLHLYSGGQGIWDDRRQAAITLGWDESRVRVTLCSNGGAFGGKEDTVVAAQAALLAYATCRPVRLVLSREESFLMHPKRHGLEIEIEAGCDGDGNLTALRGRIIGDTGPYLSVGNKVLERAAGHLGGPYRWAAMDVESRAVYTNSPVAGAFRGFGANQAAFAVEGVVDRLGEMAGLDPWEMRYRNACRPGDLWGPGQIADEGFGIVACLEAAKPYWDTWKHRAGIGAGLKNSGLGNGLREEIRARVQVSRDGQRVLVRHCWTEMGQGMNTIAQQVACTELELPAEAVSVVVDTERELGAGQTTGSRGAFIGGRAIIDACDELKRHAGTATDGRPDLLTVAGQEFEGTFVCDWTQKMGTVENPVIHAAFGFAVQIVVLDEAGHLERVIAVHDVGKALNPTLCEGQVVGSVHMGLGYALTEDFPVDDAGFPTNMTLRSLRIIRPKDMVPVETVLVEVPSPHGPYGAKGVGEIGLVPTAGAVACALHRFDGQWYNELPMRTSEAARALTNARD